MIFHVALEEGEDGWIVAECPALPGCVSQGKDEKEAIENIKEAITAWLWAEDQKAVAALSKQKGQIPLMVAVSIMGKLGNISGKEALPKLLKKLAGWQSGKLEAIESMPLI